VNKMKALNRLYSDYPKSPENFGIWRAKVDAEMEEVKARFQPNPI
jgi:hypothetical protein